MTSKISLGARIQRFLRLHPLLRETLQWAMPAMVFGAVLRALLVSYLPYAFWGPDARSFYKFPHTLLTEHYVSFPEKRRFLYPLLMVPVSLLPGAPLRWLPLFQHALGLLTVLPFAYLVRKTMVHWRLWMLPATLFFAGFPLFVWYEHELLGETLFFDTLVWTFAGWAAWVGEKRIERSRRLFWWFFVPFALFLATKPSGRFVWPGIFAGLVLTLAWRRLDWRRIIALGLLLGLTPFVGSKKQGAWILYVATFPLTQTETPLHAEYKAEIRDSVVRMRAQSDVYYFLQDNEPFLLVRDPGDQDARPLWKGLGKDEKLKSKVYFDLAFEGIRAEPRLFLHFAWQRIVASADFSAFDRTRFNAGFYREHTKEFYTEAEQSEASPVRLVFALPAHGPLPPYEEFARRLDPAADSLAARCVRAIVGLYPAEALDFFRFPKVPPIERKISLMRVAPFGWWLFAGMLLSFLPRYRLTLGVWTVVATGYLFGVFIVSLTNVRYFAPAWPVFLIVALIPADALVQCCASVIRPRPGLENALHD